MRALFTAKLLIGDALYISAALRAWIEKHRGWDIYIETLNDHILPLYGGMARDLVPVAVNPIGTYDEDYDGEQGAVKFDFTHTFDVNKAFSLSDKRKQHLAKSYADLLGVDIGNRPQDIGPFFTPKEHIISEFDLVSKLDKGMILVSMFSASDASRGNPPGPPNKMLPWDKWLPMIKLLRESYPDNPIRFLGAPTDMISFESDYSHIVQDGEYMLGIPLNKLAIIMKHAKLLVTIDNGMSHLAASQKCPTFLMYPQCLGLHYILPIGNPNLVYVQMNPMTVNPGKLEQGLKYAIKKFATVKR
jgi:ADP-heptose:LPS heptosyltransferase